MGEPLPVDDVPICVTVGQVSVCVLQLYCMNKYWDLFIFVCIADSK